MKRIIKTTTLLLAAVVFYSCNAPLIVTAWKVQHPGRQEYDKIVIAGIVKTDDDSLRIKMEDRMTKEVEGLNYRAVPAYAEFGLKGLSGLDEAGTYMRLCHNGVDVVMTMALIDGTKEAFYKPGNKYEYPASHYYYRMLNYKSIVAGPADVDSIGNMGDPFWEIILFDLNTLEATCVVQTRLFTTNINDNSIDDLSKQVIRKLRNEKILTKGKKAPVPLRAF